VWGKKWERQTDRLPPTATTSRRKVGLGGKEKTKKIKR
jgi:hypothetical protein